MSEFWQTVRKSFGAASTAYRAAFHGNAPATANRTPTAENTTPEQRAWIAGHGVNWPQSDHRAENLHFTGWNYVAAHIKAKQWAQATVTISRKARRVNKSNEAHDASTPDETPLPDHPLARLFKKPNRRDNQATFLYRLSLQISQTGAAFVWRIKNQLGYPLEWYCLPRGWFIPVMPSGQYPHGGWRVVPSQTNYGSYITRYYGTNFFLPDTDVIKIGWPDPSFPGEFTSPYTACSRIIDIAEQRDLALWSLLLKAPNPGMILSMVPGVTTAQYDRILAEIKARKAGAANAGEVLLLQGVEKYDLTNTVKELDATPGRDQDRKNVLGIQHVPEIAAGMSGSETYSGNAVAMNSFVEEAVQPDLILTALAFQADSADVYGGDIAIAIDAKRVDDPTLDLQKTDKVAAGYRDGVVSVNQYLASLDLPPVPGGDVPKADWEKVHGPVEAGKVPGVAPDGAPSSDAQPEFDLSADLGDEESSGIKRPELQAASGNRNGMPSLNGVH